MSYWRQTNTHHVHFEDFKYVDEIDIKVRDSLWLLKYEDEEDEYILSCTDIKGMILVCINVISDNHKNCFQECKIFDNDFLTHSWRNCGEVNGIELSFFEQNRDVISDTVANIKIERKLSSDHLESVENPDGNKELENEYEQLSNDLSSFWQQKILTDVDIQCGSEVYKAHKAILAARSPFFATLFQTPMEESLRNVVEIKDTKPRIFQIVLNYLYSGQKPEIEDSDTACEVMMAANLYNIPSLKLICSRFLRSALSVANALKLLIFADLHDPEFKKDVVQFICDSFDSFINTEEFANLQEQNPFLAITVMMQKLLKLNLRER